MANVFDLKSKSVVIGTAAANTSFGIGRVPAGKKRFITFVSAVNMHIGAGSTNTLYLASHTASQLTALTSATARKKIAVPFRVSTVDQVRQVPEGQIDLQNPLFSVAASNFLSARTTNGDVDVFVQYYDD